MARTRQPISEIAYASGFNDYNYFSQKFRRRFGYAPSAHAGNRPSEVKIIESPG
jgi:AraC family transcriptional regulator, positive regulator of tynA and feaB